MGGNGIMTLVLQEIFMIFLQQVLSETSKDIKATQINYTQIIT